jgi:integrase
VTREETVRVLAACPDHHWRTIVALARFGGLRTPSETLSLRWQDIDWEAGRIVVPSRKTEHYAGKASRTIPLFPELKPILAEAFD